jgi:exopolysaccharide biosynthesis polyprenyl glycosylphosphotransferase
MKIEAATFSAVNEESRKEAPRKPVALGRKQELNLQLNQLIDALLLVLSLWTANLLRRYLGQIPGIAEVEPFSAFLWVIVFIMPLGPLLLEFQGFYNLPLQKTALKSFSQIARALLWLGLLIAGCAVLFRLNLNSRSVLILFFAISALVLMIKERIAVAYLKTRVRAGQWREKVILVGSAEEIHQLFRHLTGDQLAEIDVVDRIDISSQPTSDLVQALHQHGIGRVIFASAKTELQRVEEAVAVCDIEGVEAWLAADFVRTSIARPAFDMFGPQPMLVFRSAPDTSWALLTKRTIDLAGSLFGILLLSPLMLGVAIAIKITSKGPALFVQMRSGQHGRPFRMFKFRSMYSGAEQRRQELQSLNQMSGPVFKLDRDPRITPLGRWLRKFSIDELPQLFNVLSGEMSLVGPRPLPVYEVEKFANPAQRRRLSVKPGLTCLWQISGRNEVKEFESWVKLDLKYIDNWSIWLDLKILLVTIPVVLFGYGAK